MSLTPTEVANIRLCLSGAKNPEDFGWSKQDLAAWIELVKTDPVAFVMFGVWSRRVKEGR